MKDFLLFYGPTMLAMAFGMSIHVAKKAGEALQKDKTFDLSDYILGHPFKSYASAGMSVGAYIGLVSDPTSMPTVLGAFLAGVATNSFADLFPGGERGMSE